MPRKVYKSDLHEDLADLEDHTHKIIKNMNKVYKQLEYHVKQMDKGKAKKSDIIKTGKLFKTELLHLINVYEGLVGLVKSV